MDELPQCTVCSTRFKYKDPEPKLLPCLHAVCGTCLSNNTVNCSICQKCFETEGLELPTDTVRLATIYRVTSKFNPSEFLCTHRDDGNQATSWCQECEEFYCENCQNIHDDFKLTRKHKVRGIREMFVSGERGVPSGTTCSEHDMPLEVYDEDCSCLVCYKCLRNDHMNHRTVPVEECLKRCSKELESCLDDINHKQSETADQLSLTYRKARQLEERNKTITELIQHTFQELRTLIEQREKEILMKLEESLLHIRNTNTSRQNMLKSIERNCSTAHDYISLALHTSAPGLLTLMGCIKDGIRDVEIPDVQQEKENILTFSTENLDDLKESLSCFGSIYSSLDVTATLADNDADNGVVEKQRLNQSLDADADPKAVGAVAASQVSPSGEDIVFETFSHESGREYQCLYTGGSRFFLDDMHSMQWQPFPQRWYNHGTLSSNSVARYQQTRQTGRGSSKAKTPAIPSNRDDREGYIIHPSKGKITTYLFTEKQYSHCYFDRESGSWLKLPIEWELRHDLIRNMVDQVQEALPLFKDRLHVLAALRACNYSPDECISMYFHLEGDKLMDMARSEGTLKHPSRKNTRK